MKKFLSLVLAASLGAGFLPAKTRNPDVLVVADALMPDKGFPEPTAENPAYSIFLGGKEQDIGGSIAGLPSPTADQLRELLAGQLRRHHYVETQLGGPLPQLAVVFAWGTAALDTYEEFDSETGESSTIAFNAREMRNLLGFAKARQRLISSTENDNLDGALNSDRFYILVAALDASALRNREKKVVWRTRISIDARRTTLPKSMGLMIASAGPFFGKNEDRPVFVDDALRRDAHVEVGEATVVENESPPSKAP